MDETAVGKAGWLERLEHARQTWEEIVSRVSDADISRPGAAGDWTFKDVAAHLNAWRTRTVDRLEAALRDDVPPPAPWPNELDDETDEGVDAINRWFFDRDRDRSAADIVAESRLQFQRMRAAVEALSEQDLETPGRFPWLADHPLSAVLNGSFEHLHEEHEPMLRAWLAERPEPGAGV